MKPGTPKRDARIMAVIAELDALSARPAYRAPSCAGCRAFTPDRLNPTAGVGTCAKGMGGWHAAAPHYCRERIAA